jgi:F0F1-type ATP synthase assembly protein I
MFLLGLVAGLVVGFVVGVICVVMAVSNKADESVRRDFLQNEDII